MKRAFEELNFYFEIAESYLCAAALHDVAEDIYVSLNDIQEEHGISVKIIVDVMTYDKSGTDRYRFIKKESIF